MLNSILIIIGLGVEEIQGENFMFSQRKTSLFFQAMAF